MKDNFVLCLALLWVIFFLCCLPVVLFIWSHGAASTHTYSELSRLSWVSCTNSCSDCNMDNSRKLYEQVWHWTVQTQEKVVKAKGDKSQTLLPNVAMNLGEMHQNLRNSKLPLVALNQWWKNGGLAVCFHLKLSNAVYHELACLPLDYMVGERQEQTRVCAQLHSSSHLTWRCPEKYTVLSILSP